LASKKRGHNYDLGLFCITLICLLNLLLPYFPLPSPPTTSGCSLMLRCFWRHFILLLPSLLLHALFPLFLIPILSSAYFSSTPLICSPPQPYPLRPPPLTPRRSTPIIHFTPVSSSLFSLQSVFILSPFGTSCSTLPLLPLRRRLLCNLAKMLSACAVYLMLSKCSR